MRRRIITSTVFGAIGALAVSGVALAGEPRGMYHDDDRHWFGMVVVLVIAAAAAVALFMSFRNRASAAAVAPAAGAPTSPTANAEALLAERLARGEISPDDYRITLAALRGDPGVPAAQ